MSNVAIADLIALPKHPKNILTELNIHWAAYYIHRAKETWRDLVTIDAPAFYEWLSTTTEVPKTANPSSADYEAILHQINPKRSSRNCQRSHHIQREWRLSGRQNRKSTILERCAKT